MERGTNNSVSHYNCAKCGKKSYRHTGIRHKKDGTPRNRYCSMECYKKTAGHDDNRLIKLKDESKRKAAIKKLLITLVRIAKKDLAIKTIKCKTCNKEFQHQGAGYGPAKQGRTPLYCSRKCLNKYHRSNPTEATKEGKKARNRVRRAKIKGVKYEVINVKKVFDRDKWTCKICKAKTPEKLRGTIKPNAPELDHIIPISLGGTHTWDNVQCLCRRCNGNKGSAIVGQSFIPGLEYA